MYQNYYIYVRNKFIKFYNHAIYRLDHQHYMKFINIKIL